MQIPRTHSELFEAVRELAGPEAYISVSADVVYMPNVISGKPSMRMEWRVYISPWTGTSWSTDFVPSLAAAWDAVLEHYRQTTVDMDQFDAASVEPANA